MDDGRESSSLQQTEGIPRFMYSRWHTRVKTGSSPEHKASNLLGTSPHQTNQTHAYGPSKSEPLGPLLRG